MSLYSKNELILKSRDELYKIALKEKLIDILKSDKNKKQLIDLILKYRKDYKENSIKEYSEIGFIKIQEIIDKKLVIYNKKENDIEVPRSFKLYKNVRIIKQDNYFILIEKDLDIDTNIVLLCGKNKYIYSILNLELDDKYIDNRYNRFYIRFSVDRFTDNFNNEENISLIFFNTYNTSLIYSIYNEEYLEVIPDKFLAYIVGIAEFEYLELDKTLETCPIIFSENKVICKYFEYDFNMYISSIKNKNIDIYFFDDALNELSSKNYYINATYINNIDYLLKNCEEKIYIYDKYLNFIQISKKRLLEIFFNYLKELIVSYSKKKYLSYYILGIDYEQNDMLKLDICKIFNYKLIKNRIKKIDKKYKSNYYLIVNTENDKIKITTNNYNITEKDINYEIVLNTHINTEINLSKKIIVNKIFYMLKFKMSQIEYLNFSEKELINKINNSEYKNIIEDIEKKYIKVEKAFKTDYLKYKTSINKEYINSYRNYLILNKISEYIFNNYVNKNESYVIKINDIVKKLDLEIDIQIENIEVRKEEIDLIFILEIYNFLYNYFKKIKIIDILEKYDGICLCGVLVKTNIFYNLLKEFIPGNLIQFDNDIQKSYKFLLDASYKFDKDINLGRIKFISNYTKQKEKVRVYIKNFKNEYILILDSVNKDFGYIDKINNVINIEIRIEYIDRNENKEFYYNLNRKYIEKDEKEINIEQKYLNDIENDIIRIFMKFNEENINIFFIKRKKDQIYVNEDKLIYL
ncbi:hypothetical protein [Oceanivirga salmonicida]|uniref:hypothetical protein n=2 Tax=Oceanivirga salmonicida TaxID=1769291 RepID=UPI0012E32DAA|nr:hypothetical protein [Oceanivirga salmonicida]